MATTAPRRAALADNPRLAIKDAPRPVPADDLAALPLVTIAWRALRAEHRRHGGDEKIFLEAMAGLAEEAWRLRRLARSLHSEAVAASAQHIEQALEKVRVHVVAPDGQPYTEDLMELLENTAQVPGPGLEQPQVAEVIAPAIVCRGAVLRMGKAVIAVPHGRKIPIKSE